jgi:hypothetical protein
VRSTSCNLLAAVVCGALLVACTDFAGPIPGTEQTTEGNDPVPPTGGDGASNGGTTGAQPSGGTGNDPAPPAPGGDLVSFDQDVHPILIERCGSCHEVGTPATPGHAAPDPDEAFAATQGMSMNEPVYERILARASGDDPGGFMPPSYAGCEGPLGSPGCVSLEEFALIELWVEQGAMNR